MIIRIPANYNIVLGFGWLVLLANKIKDTIQEKMYETETMYRLFRAYIGLTIL